MWKEVVRAFSVEAAQVVMMALEKASFERLVCRLVMTLLKSDGSTWFYHRCRRVEEGEEDLRASARAWLRPPAVSLTRW